MLLFHTSGLGRAPQVPVLPSTGTALLVRPDRDFYELLRRYYLSNGLYDELQRGLADLGYAHEAIKELRNPASRVVEFHVAKLWPGDLPGALPIVAQNAKLLPAIQMVWRWSNWATEKQLAARFLALYGPLFLKIAEQDGDDGTGIAARRVFIQVLDPRHVTEYNVNERGYLTYIRIDVPRVVVEVDRSGRADSRLTYWTEIWTKDRVQIWDDNRGGAGVAVGGIHGTAVKNEANSLGFIPIVYAPFRKIDAQESVGAFTQALTKIDEANRVATRLHQLLFRHNKVVWALESNANDSSGRPLPPPSIQVTPGPGGFDAPGLPADSIALGDDVMVRLPGNAKLATLIPSLDYNAMLGVLNAQLEELANELPELRYFNLAPKSGTSGVAMGMTLADAVDRVLEARGNAEAALVRAHQIALTLAQRAKLKGFDRGSIGTYEAGDFEHSIGARPVFPVTQVDRANTLKTYIDAKLPLKTALRLSGHTPEEIAQLDRDIQEEEERANRLKQEDREQALTAQEQQAKTQMSLAEEKAQRDHERGLQAIEHRMTLEEQQAERARRQQAKLAEKQAEKQAERDVQKAAALQQLQQPPPAPADDATDGDQAPKRPPKRSDGA